MRQFIAAAQQFTRQVIQQFTYEFKQTKYLHTHSSTSRTLKPHNMQAFAPKETFNSWKYQHGTNSTNTKTNSRTGLIKNFSQVFLVPRRPAGDQQPRKLAAPEPCSRAPISCNSTLSRRASFAGQGFKSTVAGGAIHQAP
jgi:hypothetical protein